MRFDSAQCIVWVIAEGAEYALDHLAVQVRCFKCVLDGTCPHRQGLNLPARDDAAAGLGHQGRVVASRTRTDSWSDAADSGRGGPRTDRLFGCTELTRSRFQDARRCLLSTVNSAVIRVGRLLEIRIDTAYRTIAEVDEMFERIVGECAKHPPHVRFAVAVDWRCCPVMSSEASERHLFLMTQRNPRVERSATLALQEAPTAMLQFMRMVRLSEHESRRLFVDSHEMITWLSEVLTPVEVQRLEQFIGRA